MNRSYVNLSSKQRFGNEVHTNFHLEDRIQVAKAYFAGKNEKMWQRIPSGN